MVHALIVEDDADTAEMMAALISRDSFTVATAGSLLDAKRQLILHPPDLLLLDVQLPDGNGFELLEDQELVKQSEIVLMTGHASVETSVQALRLGAADYLVKPVTAKQLQGVLSRVMRPAQLEQDVAAWQRELEQSGHFGPLWGRSAAMQPIYQQIYRVATTGVTVCITGESGTGKELVARSVHDLSRRRRQPFLAVNCGAVSPHLFESEIFGHEKGSFTGADRQHQGFFERANGGSLFLDEVTEMPLDLQVKLLRVLETGFFTRVGSTQAQEADVRVIAATNRSPEEAVRSGRLRQDLYYRLNVFPIEVPPLRDRPEDIPLLANHFLQAVGEQEGQAKRFSARALQRLANYGWPGNVRELRNVVQRAYVMTPDAEVSHEWLPGNGNAGAPASSEKLDDGPAIRVELGTPIAAAERQLILATLAHFDHHKERTAAALGISLKTLYNRLKEYGDEAKPSYPNPDRPEPVHP